MKRNKIIGLVIIIIIIIVVIVIIAQNLKNKEQVVVNPNTQQQGVFSSILAAITGLFKPKTITKYCDCAKPGYAADGALDPLCNANGIEYETECK